MGRGCQLHNVLIVSIALLVFLPTLNWGLPTRVTDKWLFGDRTPWTGQEILDLLAAPGEPDLPVPQAGGAIRGADVDADPILDRSKPIVLNDTDRKRAAIVQRYRLMSGQPDEFIQFKALAEMNQRQGVSKLDPRLYQYGGLWIYPVGALVKLSMIAGVIESPPPGVHAQAFYMDRPEVFGKFYVVARAYSTFWGVVAAIAVAWLARRATGKHWLGVLAAMCFIALPVTRTAAHEAKPHLAGAALCLLSIMAATKYVETRRARWLLLAGALCGAAMGMVVSMLLSIVVLPAAVWVTWRASAAPPDSHFLSEHQKRRPDWRALLGAAACGFAVYAITNPFVLYNAIVHPEILKSNLGNSTAMYGVGDGLLTSAWSILCAGVTRLGAWCALLAIVVMILDRAKPIAACIKIAGVVAIVLFIQFVALSAGKPVEYARFALLPAAIGCVCIASLVKWWLDVWPRSEAVKVVVFVLLAVPIVSGWGTVLDSVRLRYADHASLTEHLLTGVLYDEYQRDALDIGLLYEPAPWSAVPMNLFNDRLILMPTGELPWWGCDVVSYPTNLSSQVGRPASAESCDWWRNRIFTKRVRPFPRPMSD